MQKVSSKDYFEHKPKEEKNRIINEADSFVVEIYKGDKILLDEPGYENFLPFLEIIEKNDDPELLPFYACVLNDCLQGNIKIYSSREKEISGSKERYFGSTLYRQFLKFPMFYFYYRFFSSQDIYKNYSEAMISAFSPIKYEWDNLSTMDFYDFRELLSDKIDFSFNLDAKEYFEDFMFNIMLYADETIS